MLFGFLTLAAEAVHFFNFLALFYVAGRRPIYVIFYVFWARKLKEINFSYNPGIKRKQLMLSIFSKFFFVLQKWD